MGNISRRQFLKGMAAGATGLALSGIVSSAGFPKASADEGAESKEYDVVKTYDVDFAIIGSGMTGSSAAVQAAELGMSTILVEKLGYTGGSTNVAEGIFGLGSKIQEEAGQLEELPTVAELLKETQEYTHYNCNSHVIKRFYEKSGDNINWLLEQGCTLGVNDMPMKNMRHSYTATKGAGPIKDLTAKAQEAGVTYLMNTTALELIVEDGAVTGLYAENDEGYLRINAKAVLIATGGYAGNPDMLKKYAHVASGEFIKDCGMPGRNGDGINMALAAGGTEWTHMGVLQNFGPITKNDVYGSHLYAATAVAGFRFNEKGERYGDETMDLLNFAFSGNTMQQQKASFSFVTDAQIDQWVTEGGAYGGGVFLNGMGPLTTLREKLEAEMNSEDPQVFKCETIDIVAEKAGVDAGTLKASIARYNELCAKGQDEDFLKDPAWMIPVSEEGPYYLFRHKIGIFTTCDGLRVNEYAQVLNDEGEPVKGLFAGGCDAGGLLGDAYDVTVAPCTTQGWCLYCGRESAKFVHDNLL